MKHEDITPELYEDVSHRIVRFLEDKVNIYGSIGGGHISLGETAEDEMIRFLQRMYAFGVQGMLIEGNLLPGDFHEIVDLQKLEKITISLADDNDPIALISKAAFGRLRLCFHDELPLGEIYEMDEEFEDLALFYKSDMAIEELAALSNMNIRSVKNDMMKAPEDKCYKNSHGEYYVDIEYAKKWLRSRIDFKPTKNCSAHNLSNGEFILVPVASDGTHFGPACEYKRGGYTVGEKGDEIKVESFDEALDYLQAMPLAKWRRPNASGNFGIVSAVDWKRINRSEL
ncbi:hypothetical protein [Alteromonas flava]|uniref:hypothetical protein n=1 Tax=Alteromonas flava TaxID=2048003 RepID=UPI00196A61C1|nr:hypothetical protein [Alteromonas flava]